MATNRHHLLFCARDFKRRKQSNKLRNMLTCQIDTDQHQRLHEYCQPLVVPDEMTCRIIAVQLEENNYQLCDAYVMTLMTIDIASVFKDEKTYQFTLGLIHQLPYLKP